jgi:hypothetical protein
VSAEKQKIGEEGPVVSGLQKFVDEIRPLISGEPKDEPSTTPEIFGDVRTENVWHSYLAYFIDPAAAHGFEDRFLKAFLKSCKSAGILTQELGPEELNRVRVDSEVGTDEGRIPDILLYNSEWFLLLELKVDSPEGESQTADYATAETVGPVDVHEYNEEARHYGFIAPSIPDSIDDAFIGIRWEKILHRFTDVRNDLSVSNYPLRSIVQLDDFISTMKTTKPEVDETTRERAKLYFEHQAEIEAAENAAEKFVKDVLQYKWTEVFQDPDNAPLFWDESWFILHQGKTFGQFARESWSNENGLDIHFEHHPTLSKFMEGELQFRLDLEVDSELRDGPDDPRPEYRAKFIELVEKSDIDVSEETIDDGGGDLGTFHPLVEATYAYEPGEEVGYYDALLRASEEYSELIPLVDALFEDDPD